jgi:DNA-directed RNA polymerase subunit D
MSKSGKLNLSIELIEARDNRFMFLLKNVPVTVANSIRRAIISYVPTLAIDRVFIMRNDSLMNDDMLAHRLGLIPLTTPYGRYRLPEEECPEGEDCKPEYVSLTLSVEAVDEPITVYSSHIKSSDPDVKPIVDDIEIVRLGPGQGIEAEMWAYMGRGSQHAKWSPVSVAVVRGVPIIEILDPDCGRRCRKCVNACPKDVLDIVKGKLVVKDPYKCTTCKLCEEACPDIIKVDIDEGSSILYFESIGQLRPSEIINIAFDEVIKKIDEFRLSFEEGVFENVEAS